MVEVENVQSQEMKTHLDPAASKSTSATRSPTPTARMKGTVTLPLFNSSYHKTRSIQIKSGTVMD